MNIVIKRQHLHLEHILIKCEAIIDKCSVYERDIAQQSDEFRYASKIAKKLKKRKGLTEPQKNKIHDIYYMLFDYELDFDEVSLSTLNRLYQAYHRDLRDKNQSKPTKEDKRLGRLLGKYMVRRNPTKKELKKMVLKYYKKHKGKSLYPDELCVKLGVPDMIAMCNITDELVEEGKLGRPDD